MIPPEFKKGDRVQIVMRGTLCGAIAIVRSKTRGLETYEVEIQQGGFSERSITIAGALLVKVDQ